jgi:hypothetical protein
MTMSQDSSEPTGIKGDLSGGHTVPGNHVGQARNRKEA